MKKMAETYPPHQHTPETPCPRLNERKPSKQIVPLGERDRSVRPSKLCSTTPCFFLCNCSIPYSKLFANRFNSKPENTKNRPIHPQPPTRSAPQSPPIFTSVTMSNNGESAGHASEGSGNIEVSLLSSIWRMDIYGLEDIDIQGNVAFDKTAAKAVIGRFIYLNNIGMDGEALFGSVLWSVLMHTSEVEWNSTNMMRKFQRQRHSSFKTQQNKSTRRNQSWPVSAFYERFKKGKSGVTHFLKGLNLRGSCSHWQNKSPLYASSEVPTTSPENQYAYTTTSPSTTTS